MEDIKREQEITQNRQGMNTKRQGVRYIGGRGKETGLTTGGWKHKKTKIEGGKREEKLFSITLKTKSWDGHRLKGSGHYW